MRCMGLDIGSSNIKGAVLDLGRGKIGAPRTCPFPAALDGLAPGWVEVAPVAVEAAVRQLLEELLAEAPEATAVFCSGQMGGVVLVDPAGDPPRALTNYLSWRDQRTLEPHRSGGSYLDAIRSRWNSGELVELGNELQAGSASALLFWLAENGRLPPRTMPVTIADFVLARLCHARPQWDPTQAIGLLDLRGGGWHRGAFEKLGLSGVVCPDLADPRRPIGEAMIAGRRLACHASFGDQQCALRGVGLSRDELSLNISTGSQVSRRTAEFQPGPYQSRRYFNGDFLNTITHLPAGRSLNVLVDLLTELARAQGIALANPWEFIARSAAETDAEAVASEMSGGGLNVNLSFFAGALGSRGCIDGITTENLTVGNLFHAAFRSMAENYAVCAERLCPDHADLSLAISGGLPRSAPILRKLIQNKFGRPMRESAAVEETLLGLLDVARSVYLS